MADQDAFAANVDHTLSAAFGLSLRILGDRTLASSACEAAYLEAANEGSARAPWTAESELRFLRRVRELALELKSGTVGVTGQSVGRPPAYALSNDVKEVLAAADELGRKAVEMCYFGGLTAEDAAEALESTAAEVRRAMRTVLLELGNSAREPRPVSQGAGT